MEHSLGLLIPEFSYANARSEKKKINYMLNIVLKYTFIFSFAILIIFLCFSKNISNAFFNEPELAKYILILSPLVIFMYLDSVVDSILKGLDKQTQVMQINILDLLTSIFLICFFLPISGKNGYLIILYISEIFNFLLSIRALLKR